jgi:hypothetical protein
VVLLLTVTVRYRFFHLLKKESFQRWRLGTGTGGPIHSKAYIWEVANISKWGEHFVGSPINFEGAVLQLGNWREFDCLFYRNSPYLLDYFSILQLVSEESL